MNRREFVVGAGATGALLSGAQAADAKNALIELRCFRMRTGGQVQRTNEFLGKQFLPAAKRAGIGPVGFFSGVIAAESPFVLALLSYPSFAAMGAALEKLASDEEFVKALDAYNAAAELPYIRVESSLLRAFDAMPQVETPPAESGRAPRIFELRTYESNSDSTLRRKIKMFAEGEIAIFRKTGLLPVFFGEMLYGPNLPNLTYMLAFDDMAAREKNWRAFVEHPEWKKLRAMPGYADAEIVSNISNSILRPSGFSPIR